MKNHLYLAFDKVAKTNVYGIIRVNNDEVARRSFHDSLTNKDGPMAAHIGDYCLRRLGQIDEETGIIEPQDIITIIADGQDWLDANQEK